MMENDLKLGNSELTGSMCRELIGLTADKNIGDMELSKTKEKMAQSLLNGLGEAIKEEIREANNSNSKQKAENKDKVKGFFKKLFRTCS